MKYMPSAVFNDSNYFPLAFHFYSHTFYFYFLFFSFVDSYCGLWGGQSGSVDPDGDMKNGIRAGLEPLQNFAPTVSAVATWPLALSRTYCLVPETGFLLQGSIHIKFSCQVSTRISHSGRSLVGTLYSV